MDKSAISHSQLLANIANSMQSTGPRTEEGKAKARYNARRHGLTGQFYVMDDDDRQAYLTFETRLFSDLKPVGPCEEQLAVSIAQDHWRMNRAKGIEFNTMGLAHHENAGAIGADSAETETAVSHAQAWRSDNKAFANMALYELRLHRIIRQNRQDLNELQAKRHAAEAAAREEAELFLANELSRQTTITEANIQVNGAQQSGLIPTFVLNPENIEVNGAQQSGLIPTFVLNPENIQVNGFVFSIPTLYRDMAWKQTLAEARWYKSRNWDRTKQPPFALLNFPQAA